MRQISVSTDVFARIWSIRRPNEETESDVLARVLRSYSESADGGERVVQNIALNTSPQEMVPIITQPEGGVAMISPSKAYGHLVSHAAWWEVVFAALQKLGGEAQLHYLYREVEGLCKSIGKRLPRKLDATVRGTLEDNCAESGRYKHVRDVFCMPQGKGRGVWGVKKSP